MTCNVHNGDTGNFTDSSLKISIAGGHDVTGVLHNSLNYTVISIRALMGARKSLKARVFGDTKSGVRLFCGGVLTEEPSETWAPTFRVPP